MLSKRDKELLKKEGFEESKYYEIKGIWERGDWSIGRSKKESEDIRRRFFGGYRICLMYDDGGDYVLVNHCDDGCWICNGIDKCLDIVDEEEDSFGDEIVKL